MMRRLHTLLPPSALTLAFKPSRDYRCLLAVLTLTAMLLLWQAHWPWSVAVITSISLWIIAYPGIRDGKPHPHCVQLRYSDAGWWLSDVKEGGVAYTSARVRYQVGCLMCLELRNKAQTRVLFLFADQLTAAERRALYVVQLVC